MSRRSFLNQITRCLAIVALATTFQNSFAEEKVVEVNVFGAGSLEVPASFKKVAPKSSIIEHEFQAKTGEGKEGETARVTFMAAGGDVKANIQRWKGQFAGGKVINRDNYAMAGAILVHPEGRKYFVKMIGPAEVVKANRKSFVSMIKSINE